MNLQAICNFQHGAQPDAFRVPFPECAVASVEQLTQLTPATNAVRGLCAGELLPYFRNVDPAPAIGVEAAQQQPNTRGRRNFIYEKSMSETDVELKSGGEN
ncbi:MAG: hypothetical protein ACPG8W_02375 [Candidatus Promineifilaceae bacterium]